MKKLLFLFIFIAFLFFSCNKERKVIKIGVSQCNCADAWRITMNDEMIREVGLYPELNIELIIKDAQSNNNKQKQDIEDLCKLGVAVLIVSPNEAAALTEAVSNVYKKNIPVILIDRKINSPDYTSFVGGDNYQIGKTVGNYATKLLNNKGNILVIQGLKGSTPAIERTKGFNEIISKNPNLKIINSLDGNWQTLNAENLTNNFLQSNTEKIDLVFAQNDFMALGVYKACVKHKISPKILGVDALELPNCGVDMVLNKTINATFFNRSGGDKAIQLAIDIMQHKQVRKENIINNNLTVDLTNAKTIKFQYEFLVAQYDKIKKQHAQIGKMANLISRQKIFLLLSVIIIILMIIVIVLIIYFLKQKEIANQLIRNHEKMIKFQMDELYKTNAKLNEQQLKIEEKHSLLVAQSEIINSSNSLLEERQQQVEEQSEELLCQRDELNDLNATKDKLFSILVHDLRNSFNVITGFSELIMVKTNTLDEVKLYKYLNLIHLASYQGSTLIEKILEWYKMQTGKITFHPEHLNIENIINETIVFLQIEASAKNISFKQSLVPNMTVFADENMVKAILRNLISNAIKFTQKSGNIHIKAYPENELIKISITDNGVGISIEKLDKLFNFYHSFSTKGTNHEPGTGLGLIICKEFVERQGGTIWAESILDQGSTFNFTLPIN